MRESPGISRGGERPLLTRVVRFFHICRIPSDLCYGSMLGVSRWNNPAGDEKSPLGDGSEKAVRTSSELEHLRRSALRAFGETSAVDLIAFQLSTSGANTIAVPSGSAATSRVPSGDHASACG